MEIKEYPKMIFTLPEYRAPDFSARKFVEAPDVKSQPVIADGVAPDLYHAT